MQVHLVEQALPAGLLGLVAADANALANCNNFWVSKVGMSS